MVLQQKVLALMHLLSVLHELQQDWSLQMLMLQHIAVKGFQLPGMHVTAVVGVEGGGVKAVVEGEVDVAMVQLVLK